MTMTKTITASSILRTETTQFAMFLHAYRECSPAIREVVDEMTEILVDAEATEDDRLMATTTIIEAIFPGLSVDMMEDFSNGMQSSTAVKVRAELDAELDAEEATFAERLRAIMQAKGVSQEQLALMTGVGQPAISNMLKRQCRPQRRTIVRLAQALDVAESELWPVE